MHPRHRRHPPRRGRTRSRRPLLRLSGLAPTPQPVTGLRAPPLKTPTAVAMRRTPKTGSARHLTVRQTRVSTGHMTGPWSLRPTRTAPRPAGARARTRWRIRQPVRRSQLLRLRHANRPFDRTWQPTRHLQIRRRSAAVTAVARLWLGRVDRLPYSWLLQASHSWAARSPAERCGHPASEAASHQANGQRGALWSVERRASIISP